MNPIVIIGLVAVITSGIYATYDGLQKQAELAALHADMLSRQHAAQSVFLAGSVVISGDSDSNQTDIIITNNGMQPATLIQLRMYNTSMTDGLAGASSAGTGLLSVWHVDYELPPLRSINLTNTPLGTNNPELSGYQLRETFLADASVSGYRVIFRGVTSGGGIFDIDDSAFGTAMLRQDLDNRLLSLGNTGGNGSGLADAFTNLAILVPDGGFNSQRGAGTTYEYHYIEYGDRCKKGKPTTTSRSWEIAPFVWYNLYYVYDKPYLRTESKNPPPYPRPFAVGDPSWWFWEQGGAAPTDRDLPNQCHVKFPTLVPGTNNFPGGRYDGPGVHKWYRVASLADYNVSPSVPISQSGSAVVGNLTAPADGTIMIRVEAPVTARATGAFDGKIEHTGFRNIRCDIPSLDNEATKRAAFDAYIASKMRSVGQSASAPQISLNLDFDINGTPVGGLPLPPPVSLEGTVATSPSGTITHRVAGTSSQPICVFGQHVKSDGSWSYSGVFAGLSEITVNKGDILTFAGDLTVVYAPSVSGATVKASYAELTVSSPSVLVGFRPTAVAVNP